MKSAYREAAAKLYSSDRWKRARRACLERDLNRCTAEELDGARCEETENLHVDHTVEAWLLLATGRDPCDVDFLQTVCASHHAQLGWLRRRQARKLGGWLGELADAA